MFNLTNFEFAWPYMALLILLPVLVRLLWIKSTKADRSTDASDETQTDTLLHPAIENLQACFNVRVSSGTFATRLSGYLQALLWAFLTLAMMRPQWLEPYTEAQAPGYDLMLAIDASHSMEALDFTVQGRQVTRMAVLKGVMDSFIKNRSGDRVGLIIYGSMAYVLSPLTYDLRAVASQLDSVVPNIAGQGTAMGDAIGLGVKKLRERPKGSRVLILVTDGDNTAGLIPPREAARLAAFEGVRIYTIGVGSNEKRVQIYENGQLTTRDDLNMDEEVLREIAGITGGAYFRASNTHALEEIYQRIDELEKTQANARTMMIPHNLYRWPLAGALLTLLLLGMFPEGRMREFAGRRS
jgi:Ca-activated chloride channel homolog